MEWSEVAALVVVILTALLGVILTLCTLPGTWLMVLASLLMLLWQPGMFKWYTIAGLAVLAIAAEVFELLSGAVGAKKFGGSRNTAWGAIGGGILGAILGTVLFPIVGTIVGAVAGAGGGAMIVERHMNSKSWNDAAKIGTGAAVGRLAAVIIKGSIAAVMAIILIVDAVVK